MTVPQVTAGPGAVAPEAASPTQAEARKRRDAPAGPASRRILGMRVDATSYAEAAEAVLERAERGAGGMVCVATAHMVMEAFDAPDLRRAVNSADRVTPDGMSLVWALRRLGLGGVRRVYGPRLMPEICARAEARGVAVGLYGGTPSVLQALRARLLQRFPRLQLRFSHSPPFRALLPEEDEAVVDAIVDSGVGVLFVGLGCPKQERWMAEHREALPCVLVGVGAAFDFLAGAKPQAPGWMQRAGLEWLFRLACEPRRLWRRYLLGNARFLHHFVLKGNRAP